VSDGEKPAVGLARGERAIREVRRLDDLFELRIDPAAAVRPVAGDADRFVNLTAGAGRRCFLCRDRHASEHEQSRNRQATRLVAFPS
jgi:hypothetical protein